ncbi:leucine-rich repeat-containing G-protein coupled receptor 4-like [Chironomus tepperi]|uniref:leucine-rich repeat-containing G-protein coupled receptor 4-like n=1 Tax=Chironomus tepperi TaxID=113505 RepID=UPI00391F13A0
MAIKEIFVFVACSALICGLGDSADMECEFENSFFITVGDVYHCDLQNTVNIKSKESAVINSVAGTHETGKSNSDVAGFYSEDSSRIIEYFPRNLASFFTNIKMIFIRNGRIKEVQQSDLKPFPNLIYLALSYNDIEFLEDGLFAYNPELKVVRFSSNKIIHIGTQVFENLNNLAWLYLNGNNCISMYADNNQTAVKEVISQAKLKCFGFSDIEKELQKLEDSLIYVTCESFPIFDQNLQNLQNRFQNSSLSNSTPLKERFQAISSKAINTKITAMDTKVVELDLKVTNLTSIMHDFIQSSTTSSNQLKDMSHMSNYKITMLVISSTFSFAFVFVIIYMLYD